jgi:hypothetical protein
MLHVMAGVGALCSSPLRERRDSLRRIIRVLTVAAVMTAMLAVGALPAFASDLPDESACGAAYGAHVAGMAQTHTGGHNPGQHQGFSGFPVEEELDC